MKNLYRIALSAVAILMMTTAPGWAGEESTDHRLILVHEVFVNPDRAADHEGMVKDFLAMTPELGHAMPFSTFSIEDGRYFYATAVDGYAGLQTFKDAWNTTMAKMVEEKMAEMLAKAEGVAQYGHDSLWWERLDLSHIPEGVEVDPSKATFRSWGWFYGKPGHEMKIEEYFKKYIDLYKKHDIKRGWYTYVGDIGADMPVCVWAEIGESEAAFAATSEEIQKKLGDDAMNLWTGMVQHARKVEMLRGMYRPELSYSPKADE